MAVATPLIKFGTSGWRGLIGDDFTFPRVRLATRAVVDHMKAAGTAARGLAVGYDPRFLSEHFAAEAAAEARGQGIEVLLSSAHVPTPVVSHVVRARGLGGAINITASHNPAPWSGFKFNNEKGAPAPPETTKDLEARIARLLESPGEAAFAGKAVAVHHQAGAGAGGHVDAAARRSDAARTGATGSDPSLDRDVAPARDEAWLEPYADQLARIVRFEEIRGRGIKIAVDPLWGAARGYLAEILGRHGVAVVSMHEERDVNFGGLGPDPSPKNLAELQAVVRSGAARIGIATDGDADRFGIVDADGSVVGANTILALLADYLAESRGWRQGVARTYATTRLIDAVAEHYGMPLHQTPVGFKYLGELILDGKAYLAGEESAGMSVAGHVPEKDGMIAGLLTAEMVAATGKSLGELRSDLFRKVGAWYSGREDTPVSEEQVTTLRQRMKAPPSKVGSRAVREVTVLDGLRLDFEDGSWLLMRPSGTEPVVRYYVEARTPSDLEALTRDGKAALLG